MSKLISDQFQNWQRDHHTKHNPRTHPLVVVGRCGPPTLASAPLRSRQSHASACVHLGLGSGFDPPDLDRPGRLPHQQGLCEARLAATSARGTICVSRPSQDAAAARRAPLSAHAADRQVHFWGAGRPVSPAHIGPSNACSRAAPETTPFKWRLFLIKLSLSLSLSRARATTGCSGPTLQCLPLIQDVNTSKARGRSQTRALGPAIKKVACTRTACRSRPIDGCSRGEAGNLRSRGRSSGRLHDGSRCRDHGRSRRRGRRAPEAGGSRSASNIRRGVVGLMPFFLQRMLLTFLVVIRTHGSCQMMQKRVTWHPGFFFHSFMERKTASDALLHRLAAPSQKRS